MNLWDAYRLIAVVDEVKSQLAEAADSTIGTEGQLPIPDAKRLNALLVKGRGGRRVRITGIVYEREK